MHLAGAERPGGGDRAVEDQVRTGQRQRAVLALAGSPSLRLTTTTGRRRRGGRRELGGERERRPAAAAQADPADQAPSSSSSREPREVAVPLAGARRAPGRRRRPRAAPDRVGRRDPSRDRRPGERRGHAAPPGEVRRGRPSPARAGPARPADRRRRSATVAAARPAARRWRRRSVPMPRPWADRDAPGGVGQQVHQPPGAVPQPGAQQAGHARPATIRSSASVPRPSHSGRYVAPDRARTPATSGCRRRCRRPPWRRARRAAPPTSSARLRCRAWRDEAGTRVRPGRAVASTPSTARER